MSVTPRFPDQISVREARAEFFATSGFGPDGGYARRWVKLGSAPWVIYFPNTESRRRAVRLHDLHHIAAGYDTSWTGEAEIAAWEIGGSCRDHYAAWILNLCAWSYGQVIAPRRVFRAFVRGRHGGNLYGEEFHEALLEETVGSLRHRLGVDGSPARPTGADIAAFCMWAGLAAALLVLPIAVGLAVVVLGARIVSE